MDRLASFEYGGIRLTFSLVSNFSLCPGQSFFLVGYKIETATYYLPLSEILFFCSVLMRCVQCTVYTVDSNITSQRIQLESPKEGFPTVIYVLMFNIPRDRYSEPLLRL